MKRAASSSLFLLMSFGLVMSTTAAFAEGGTVADDNAAGLQATPTAARAPIEDLGDHRYRVGKIVVDKSNQTFTVPGLVAHSNEPLEYLAVTGNGVKEYESLLTLDTNATQFQVACILIGLDDTGAQKPRHQFDEREALGQVVTLDISWEIDGTTKTVPAGEALLSNFKPLPDQTWVYTGSYMQEDGRYMAEVVGTLVSFVHDPVAIIDNRTGLGIGAYGGITGNPLLLPPEGASVLVSVSIVNPGKSGEEKPKKIRKD